MSHVVIDMRSFVWLLTRSIVPTSGTIQHVSWRFDSKCPRIRKVGDVRLNMPISWTSFWFVMIRTNWLINHSTIRISVSNYHNSVRSCAWYERPCRRSWYPSLYHSIKILALQGLETDDESRFNHQSMNQMNQQIDRHLLFGFNRLFGHFHSSCTS
jgi:hypothetical protein